MRRWILVLFFGLLQVSVAPAQEELKILVGPYLQNVGKTGITILWETNRPAVSVVEFGERTPFSQRVEKKNPTRIHEVRLDGLQPETTYFYRVLSYDAEGDRAASDTLSFQTAVREETPFAFGVVGDTRTYPDRWRRIAGKVWQERPNFVIHVGDVVTDGRKKWQWKREFLDPARVLMSRVPLFVAIGNHERNAHWFYDYMSNPAPENYYSFRYGNAEFFIVDSNDKKGLEPGGNQYRWLEKSLAHSRAVWKFVVHHHPPYSSDSDDYGNSFRGPTTRGDKRIRKLVPLYEKYGVDIVWVGHIHSYERTWPIRQDRVDPERGVIYIQVGGGGAELEEFAPTRSWFTAKVLRNWQYCLVLVQGRTLFMMAYDITGKLYDYLQLQK